MKREQQEGAAEGAARGSSKECGQDKEPTRLSARHLVCHSSLGSSSEERLYSFHISVTRCAVKWRLPKLQHKHDRSKDNIRAGRQKELFKGCKHRMRKSSACEAGRRQDHLIQNVYVGLVG
eukprot:6201580-Pleurochrysis_carterae.AAC.3